MLALNPKLPTYSLVRSLVPRFNGRSRSTLRRLLVEIEMLRGTVGAPRLWRDLSSWTEGLPDRELIELVNAIWDGHTFDLSISRLYGTYLFINTHAILGVDPNGNYFENDLTRGFLTSKDWSVTEADYREGILSLLSIVKLNASKTDVKKKWSEFCSANTRARSDHFKRELLSCRIINLEDRGILTSGKDFTLTRYGSRYLAFCERNLGKEIIA